MNFSVRNTWTYPVMNQVKDYWSHFIAKISVFYVKNSKREELIETQHRTRLWIDSTLEKIINQVSKDLNVKHCLLLMALSIASAPLYCMTIDFGRFKGLQELKKEPVIKFINDEKNIKISKKIVEQCEELKKQDKSEYTMNRNGANCLSILFKYINHKINHHGTWKDILINVDQHYICDEENHGFIPSQDLAHILIFASKLQAPKNCIRELLLYCIKEVPAKDLYYNEELQDLIKDHLKNEMIVIEQQDQNILRVKTYGISEILQKLKPHVRDFKSITRSLLIVDSEIQSDKILLETMKKSLFLSLPIKQSNDVVSIQKALSTWLDQQIDILK